MGGVAKPLLPLRGAPLIRLVAEALSPICRVVVAALSPRTLPAYRLAGGVLDAVYTPGRGYVDDLRLVLRLVHPRPVLVAAADLVEEEPGCIERLVEEALGADADIVTFTRGGEPLGLSIFKRDSGPWLDLEAPCLRDVDTWLDYRGATAATRRRAP